MMFDRRAFLLSAAAAGLGAVAGPALAAIDPGLRTVLDAIADDLLAQSPEQLSYLGLDTGARAGARARLADVSPAARARTIRDVRRYQAMLARVDRKGLTLKDGLLYDSVAYLLANGAGGDRFAYGTVGALGGGNPYVISQQDGAYQSGPEFLDSVHRVETKADADAYLSRLQALARVLDEQTAQAKHDAGLGVIAPDFLLDTTLGQMKGLRAARAAEARMVTSLTRRTGEKAIPGDWGGARRRSWRPPSIPRSTGRSRR